MKMKATLRLHFTVVRRDQIKKTMTRDADEDHRKTNKQKKICSLLMGMKTGTGTIANSIRGYSKVEP